MQQPIAVPRINPVLLLNHRGGSVFVLIFALILVFVLIFVLVALILILVLILTVVVLILIFVLVSVLVLVIFEAFHYLKLRSFFRVHLYYGTIDAVLFNHIFFLLLTEFVQSEHDLVHHWEKYCLLLYL